MMIRMLFVLGALWVLVAGSATAQNRHEHLIWGDEFNNSGAISEPDPANWKFETGSNGFGNQELETYCSFRSAQPPCDAAQPNAFVGKDGYLHMVARDDEHGHYTSARITTEGLKS